MHKTLAKVPDRLLALRVVQRLLLDFSRERKAPVIKFVSVGQSWEGLQALAAYTTEPNFEIDGDLPVAADWRGAVGELLSDRDDAVFADAWLEYEWGTMILHWVKTWRPKVPELWRASAERWCPNPAFARSNKGRFISLGISRLSDAFGATVGPDRTTLPTGGTAILNCRLDSEEVAVEGSRLEVRVACAAFLDLLETPNCVRSTVAGSIARIEQLRSILVPGSGDQRYYHSFCRRSSPRGTNVDAAKLAMLVRELVEYPGRESFITFGGFKFTFTDQMDDGSNSLWWIMTKPTSPTTISLSTLDPIPRREIARMVAAIDSWLNHADGEAFVYDLPEDEELDDL